MAMALFLLRLAAIVIAAALPALSSGQAIAQDFPGEPKSEAAAGEPFGVGHVTIELPPNETLTSTGHSLTVTEKNGRVYYASYQIEPFAKVTWEVLKRPENVLNRERRLKVFFLFKGAEPLDLAVFAPKATTFRVEPRSTQEGRHADLLKLWWSHYTSNRKQAASDEYPRLVDDYLVAMLARRLDLDSSSLDRHTPRSSNELNRAIGLLTGTESVRAAMQKETMLADEKGTGQTTEKLPQPVAPPTVEFPKPAADVRVEAIANHVPHECFYIRFGSFKNFQWFRKAIDRWGGDLRTIVAYRALDYDINAHIQQQLVLRETALAKLLGPQVIADVAIVGHDTFLREGASTGVLFQAKNHLALAAALNQQRREALNNRPDTSEVTVEIAGHNVSFISTPDNRVRSYYAVDGDFHLVATSRTLVERFFASGKNDRSLGQSLEFRSARTRMPLARDDTAFVYLSDEFFRLLTGPHCRIEMTRRLRSAAEIDLVHMAQLAAESEKRPSDTVKDLIHGGFLPQGFGERPDGSQLVFEDGDVTDSLRGAAASFIPIPDVEIERATAAEVRAYEQFAFFYRSQWQRMDPVMVGLKRLDGANDVERLDIDIHITPVAQQHYGMLAGFLGPPQSKRLAPVDGDLVSLQAEFGDAWGRGRLFAGLRNAQAPFAVDRDGEFPRVDHQEVRAYVGGDRNNSLLRIFGEQPFDAEGFAQPNSNSLGSLWQRRNDQFHLLSMHREVLVDVMPQLKYVDAPREAQLRLRVGDLARSKMHDLVNAYGYAQARRISNGNLRLLQSVSSQLGVDSPRARRVAERLLGAKLICPIGGDYKLEAPRDEYPRWSSTISPGDKPTRVPKGFTASPLMWFRGLELEFTLKQNELSVHAEVHVQSEKTSTNAY